MATLERAFPSAETVPLRRVARRTTIIRFGLALALVAALALAFLAARDSDVRHAPLVPSGTTGVVVLDLSASVYEAAFGSTLQKMARQGERAGPRRLLGLGVRGAAAGNARPRAPAVPSLLPPRPELDDRQLPGQPVGGLPRRYAHLGGSWPRRTLRSSTRARRRARSSSSPTSRSSPTRWRGSAT